MVEDHVRLVKEVFHQVWSEFYANRPAINLDLTPEKSVNIAAETVASTEPHAETSLQGSRRALRAILRAQYPEYASAAPKIIAPAGEDSLGPSVGLEVKGKLRPLKTSNAIKSSRIGPVRNCPEYSFCRWHNGLVKVWHDHQLSFITMALGFEEELKYIETFKVKLKDTEGLDPDVDIILFETVGRLVAEGLSEMEIDNTRVLPTRCSEILFYEDTREMPAFPRIGLNGEKRWESRILKPKPERQGNEGKDTIEIFCPAKECTMNCFRHIGDARHDYIYSRRPGTATYKGLAIPAEPCSDDCVYHLDPNELETSNDAEHLRSKFTRDQLSELLYILPELERLGSSYCEATLLVTDATCREIALELRDWRGRIMLEEETKPIPDDHGIAAEHDQASEQASNQGKNDIDWKIPSLGYCTHLGPCGPNCHCTKNGSSCESTCHCDVDCPRRWPGCTCHADPSNKQKKCHPEKCECRKNNRECDPTRCKGCVVPMRKLLEQSSTHPEPVCQNMATSGIDRPKAVVRISKIKNAGYGLFAGEHIKKGQVIDEYVGEVVDTNELNRRSLIYVAVGRNYAYDLGHNVYVDGYNIGNRTRFCNGASGKNANVVGDTKIVCGEPRIVLRTTRPIKKGEEMLLDYGHEFVGAGGGAKQAPRGRPKSSNAEHPPKRVKDIKQAARGKPKSTDGRPQAKRPKVGKQRSSEGRVMAGINDDGDDPDFTM